MAKMKQAGSAAQRRAQERQQRQRRDDVRVSALNKGRGTGKGPTIRKKNRSGLYMVIGVLGLIVALIIVLVVLSRQPAATTATAADPAIVQQVTGVSQSTWEAVGTGAPAVPTNPFKPQHGQPILKGPNGHPEFFYVGALYCPNCAAERWSMVNALSRFGTFKNLSQIQSSESNISTFSFGGSSYTSQYVDFVPKEILGQGTNPPALDTLTATQQQNFTKFNSGLAFPYVNVGNQYIAIGSSYSPQILQDSSANSYSWQDIGSSLSNTKSPIAQGILGTANYMTAAICNLTNQQPGNVCSVPVIQQIEHTLGKTSNTASSNVLALAPADLRAASRRALG
jgi:hypothetical protein